LALLLRHLPAGLEPVVVFANEGRFAEEVRGLGIDTFVVPLGRRSAASTREQVRLDAIFDLPQAIVAMRRLLERVKADVVHTNTIKAHVVGGPAARLAGIPCVAHIRDILEGFGRDVVRTAIWACTHERIAISKTVDVSFALPRTTVVDNPLDLTRYERAPRRVEARAVLGIPSDGLPVIGMVGRINRWKGQDRFLRAIARVREHIPVRAAIAGAPLFRDADFVPELRNLARSLGLGDVVTFLDWQPDPRSIYAALDVHVNASTREPFGRSVIEAAAMSIPSVCFDDSGVADSMRQGKVGIVVPAGDEGALAEAIVRYASRPEILAVAGADALAWASRFDANLHARRVCDILSRAARQGSGGAERVAQTRDGMIIPSPIDGDFDVV
jgi:glycosyltransferase involved in cell wall biosynthesis